MTFETPAAARRSATQRVRTAVETSAGITRGRLARELNLPLGTVTTAAAALLRSGAIVERPMPGPADGTAKAGRPALHLLPAGPVRTVGAIVWSLGRLQAAIATYEGAILERTELAATDGRDPALLDPAVAFVMRAIVTDERSYAAPDRLVLGVPAPFQRGVGISMLRPPVPDPRSPEEANGPGTASRSGFDDAFDDDIDDDVKRGFHPRIDSTTTHDGDDASGLDLAPDTDFDSYLDPDADLDLDLNPDLDPRELLRRRREADHAAPGNYVPWLRTDPTAEISERLGIPVVIENDANLGAFGEARVGAARGHQSLVYLKLDERSVGAGLVLGGRLHRGAAGFAGEIAHVNLTENGPLCACGSRGCLVTRIKVLFGEMMLTAYDRPVSFAELLELAAAGEAGPVRVLRDVGRVLGRPLADLCTLLNPSMLVLDGSLGPAARHLRAGLAEQIDRYAGPPAAAALRIRAGELGADADIIGAVELARLAARAPHFTPARR